MVNRIPRIALAVNELNVCIRMNQQQANEFSASVASSANDSDFYLVVHMRYLFLGVVFSLNSSPDDILITKNLTKTSNILTCETAVHLSVLAKFAVHEVIA